MFLLGDKQEAKFKGVDRSESCMHFSKISCAFIAQLHDSHSYSLILR